MGYEGVRVMGTGLGYHGCRMATKLPEIGIAAGVVSQASILVSRKNSSIEPDSR